MIFLVGLLVLISLFILLLILGPKPKKRFSRDRVGQASLRTRGTYQQRIEEIKQLENLGKPSQLKQAVMESDKLLYLILGDLAPREEGFVEKMKKVRSKFSNPKDYDNLWRAHKTRNILAHEIETHIPAQELKRVLDLYQQGIERLLD